jgi:hypothetical protein
LGQRGINQIAGERVSQSPSDKKELVPTLAAIPSEAGHVSVALADSGFFSENAVQRIERTGDGASTGTLVWAAVAKTDHHRSVAVSRPDSGKTRRLSAVATAACRYCASCFLLG